MIFRQITHDDLGCASYLIGDEHAGVAAVVDPKLEIDEYLSLARYMAVSIEHILETHNHADHVSGPRAPRRRDRRDHPHPPRRAARITTTSPSTTAGSSSWARCASAPCTRPGHRPEHTAFALIDTGRAAEPWAVLTGDTLFVGDIARPDLAVDKEEGARGIFRSLHQKLLSLADSVEVWPGHLGGSLCGGPGMDMKVSSTIGFERRHNDLLQRAATRTASSSARPHRCRPSRPTSRPSSTSTAGPLMREGVEAHPLTPRQVEQMRAGGALVVDVRTALQFDEAHLPGSVSIPAVQAGFGTKLSWLADRAQEVVLIGRDDEDGVRAAQLAAAVGITRIGGYLAGGMTSWREEKRSTGQIERIDVPALHDRLEREPQMQVLDVREQAEWDERHIPGSVHHSLPRRARDSRTESTRSSRSR